MQRAARLRPGQRSRCARCGRVLQHRPRDVVSLVLAWSLASALLFVVANVYPFMTMTIAGRSETSRLVTGMFVFLEQGFWELSLALASVSVIAPGLVICGLLAVSLPLKLGLRPPAMATLLRLLGHLRPWSMMEVYLLGVVVSWVKLSQMSTITFGPAAWAFAALIVTLTGALAAFDPAVLWEHVEPRR